VNDGAKSGLALHYGVRDTHLSAKSWEENNELDGVNIVGDEDQSGLLVLDQTNDVVETELSRVGLLANIFLLLALCNGGSLLLKTLLLLGLALRAVLVEELECLSGGVAVEDVLKLGDRRWDLHTEVEDLLLALKTDILWPADHTGEITSRLDVLTDAIVSGALLDERVLGLL